VALQQPTTNRGPDGVCICNECFDLCVEILEERRTVHQRVRRHPTLSVM
jgi:ATP-dependent protease Clp ATPase subunit